MDTWSPNVSKDKPIKQKRMSIFNNYVRSIIEKGYTPKRKNKYHMSSKVK